MYIKNIIKKKFFKRIILGSVAVIILLLLSFSAYSIVYAGKIYRNQYIGNQNYAGQKKTQAKALFESQAEAVLKESINLKYEDGSSYELSPSDLGLTYKADESIEEIWSAGRSHNPLAALSEQIKSLFKKTQHRAIFEVNGNVLNEKIAAIAGKLDQKESDFNIEYDGDKFVLNTERKEGRKVNQTEIISKIRSNLENFRKNSIIFGLQIFEPKVDGNKARAKLDEANKILSYGSIELQLLNDRYYIDQDSIAGFIYSDPDGDDLKIVFNDERIRKYVETLAKSIDLEPINAKLTVKNGKVTVLVKSQIGKSLDQKQTIEDIKNTILARLDPGLSGADARTINLKAEIKEPEINDDQIESYGIKDLVGTAATSFKGSPSNRVHNITVGAGALNGILIKPGEVFSTLSHLGEIDASSGYLEELVIKESRTVPEFGGGLCQVSSTLFRAAIYSGMEIVERRNHKYRVSYYEPPVGMDATIYNPAPDLKFKNNYNSYILIQSRIEGTKLAFDFYGTNDNRKIEISQPEVFDYVDPGPPEMIETDTLPPGERKQVEKAHQGASARFNYKVSSVSGEILQEQIFFSKYIPWPEKWLVGKAIETPPAPTCTDAQQNGDETGVDCGGSCTPCAQQ